MRDDSTDMVTLRIDIGYLVTVDVRFVWKASLP
jgi:hypothetical protein